KKQEIVWVLAGILRIAEGLDRRQIQNVDDVELTVVENKLTIKIIENGSETPDIEMWGADRRKAMLEEALNLEITFE
ncbi:MAG: Ppx/GppA family phosphatase, partial [Candidatus Kapaibacterium sp.]